jgi:UDP-glucose 4-epimerase
MKILVTGLGFIGSHTVVELQNEGFEVVIIDNLSNSTEDVLKVVAITGKMPIFEKLDLREKQLFKIFKRHSDVSGVIHFCGF